MDLQPGHLGPIDASQNGEKTMYISDALVAHPKTKTEFNGTGQQRREQLPQLARVACNIQPVDRYLYQVQRHQYHPPSGPAVSQNVQSDIHKGKPQRILEKLRYFPLLLPFWNWMNLSIGALSAMISTSGSYHWAKTPGRNWKTVLHQPDNIGPKPDINFFHFWRKPGSRGSSQIVENRWTSTISCQDRFARLTDSSNPLPLPWPTFERSTSQSTVGVLEWIHGRDEATCSPNISLWPQHRPKTRAVGTTAGRWRVGRNKGICHNAITMLPLKWWSTAKVGCLRHISIRIGVRRNECRAESIRVQSMGRPYSMHRFLKHTLCKPCAERYSSILRT